MIPLDDISFCITTLVDNSVNWNVFQFTTESLDWDYNSCKKGNLYASIILYNGFAETKDEAIGYILIAISHVTGLPTENIHRWAGLTKRNI